MSRLTLAVVSSLALSALTGCADNQESLIVLMAPLWNDDGDCGVTDSTDAMLQGTLDLSFGTPYIMPALLYNQTLKQNAAKKNTGTMSNELQVIDATVSLQIPQAPEIISDLRAQDDALVHFDVPLSTNSIPPQSTAGVLVEIVPQQTAVALATAVTEKFGAAARVTLRADVQFHASRSGNTVGRVGEIDARAFSFPVSLCLGCLIDCSTCPDQMCPAQASSFNGGVCGNAQDLALIPAGCEEMN
ncbi:MAG: hypothetical protein U0168_25640 [Nannocystaceae bacterium]